MSWEFLNTQSMSLNKMAASVKETFCQDEVDEEFPLEQTSFQ